MLRRLGKSDAIRSLLGRALAGYIRMIGRTTAWTYQPEPFPEEVIHRLPVIFALWHGQHLLVPYFRPANTDMRVLISRHGDGEINAIAAAAMGIGLVRGSGGHGDASKTRKRRGAEAFRVLLRALDEGASVVLTADVPKVAGVAGQGIVTLAKMSGRPICPVAIATRHHLTLRSWDRASVPLPFGRGALVVGDPITVERDASEEVLEQTRVKVQQELNDLHAQAYEMAGCAPWRPRHG